MKAVNYNPSNKRITFQTGNKLKDVVAALQKYKRGFAHGVCDDVGIGGHPGRQDLFLTCRIILSSYLTSVWWFWVGISDVGTQL